LEDLPGWEAATEANELAIGQFFVAFSTLVGTMEQRLSIYFADCGVPEDAAQLPFGTLAADSLGRVFFETALHAHDHGKKEERIASRLAKEVQGQIPFRNDMAHGLLSTRSRVFSVATGEWEVSPPLLSRTKPGRKAGARVHRELGTLRETTNDLNELAASVSMYGAVCFDQAEGYEIRDLIRLSDKGDLIRGPKNPLGHPPKPDQS